MSATASLSPPLIYVESDIPEGMTLVEWRRLRHPPVPRGFLRRALRRLARGTHH
jgi:hypothetical protein